MIGGDKVAFDNDDEMIRLLANSEMPTCGICMDEFNTDKKAPKILKCGHNFCEDCLFRMIAVAATSANRPHCPICRMEFVSFINNFAYTELLVKLDAIKQKRMRDDEIFGRECGQCHQTSRLEKMRLCETCENKNSVDESSSSPDNIATLIDFGHKTPPQPLCFECCVDHHIGHRFRPISTEMATAVVCKSSIQSMDLFETTNKLDKQYRITSEVDGSIDNTAGDMRTRSPSPAATATITAANTNHQELVERGRAIVREYQILKKEKWYAGRISRSDAENLLRNKGYRNGTFLVRVSGKETSNEYALSVVCLNMITHYKILQNVMTLRYFITSKKTFSSIRELVNTYRDNAHGMVCKLTDPVPQLSPVE